MRQSVSDLMTQKRKESIARLEIERSYVYLEAVLECVQEQEESHRRMLDATLAQAKVAESHMMGLLEQEQIRSGGLRFKIAAQSLETDHLGSVITALKVEVSCTYALIHL
jgi:hypothetical protein